MKHFPGKAGNGESILWHVVPLMFRPMCEILLP